MNKLVRLSILYLLLPTLFACQAASQEMFNLSVEEVLSKNRHWTIGYSQRFGENKGADACLAVGRYRSGSSLAVARQKDGRWVVAAANHNWKSIRPGNSYDVVFKFDTGGRSTGSAVGISTKFGSGLIIGIDYTFVDWFSRAGSVALWFEGRKVDSFSLRGSQAAIGSARDCFKSRIVKRDPFAARPQQSGIDPGRERAHWTPDQIIPGTRWVYSERLEEDTPVQCRIDLNNTDRGYKTAVVVLSKGSIGLLISDKNWKHRINMNLGWMVNKEFNATLHLGEDSGRVLAKIMNANEFLVLIPKERPKAIQKLFELDSFGLSLRDATGKFWLAPGLPKAALRLKQCVLFEAAAASPPVPTLEVTVGQSAAPNGDNSWATAFLFPSWFHSQADRGRKRYRMFSNEVIKARNNFVLTCRGSDGWLLELIPPTSVEGALREMGPERMEDAVIEIGTRSKIFQKHRGRYDKIAAFLEIGSNEQMKPLAKLFATQPEVAISIRKVDESLVSRWLLVKSEVYDTSFLSKFSNLVATQSQVEIADEIEKCSQDSRNALRDNAELQTLKEIKPRLKKKSVKKVDSYSGLVRKKIANAARSVEKGHKGSVRITVRITDSGLASVGVTGPRELASAVRSAVREASFPSPPEGESKSYSVTISFR